MMKKIKKILTVVFAVCICFTLLPMNLLHAEEGGSSEFTVYYHNLLLGEDAVVKDTKDFADKYSYHYDVSDPVTLKLNIDGMEFRGWNTESDGSGSTLQAGDSFDPYSPRRYNRSAAGMNEDKTELHLYAQYVQPDSTKMTITFCYQQSPIYTKTYDKGTMITIPSLKSLGYSGYYERSAGWSRDSESSNAEFFNNTQYTSEQLTNSDITLYSIESDDGGLKKIIYHNKSEEYVDNLPEGVDPTIINYTTAGFTPPSKDAAFVGWTEIEDEKEFSTYYPNDRISKWVYAQETIDLYAQWAEGKHTVSFDTNGGSGNVPSTITRNNGEEAVIPSGDDISSGDKVFYYWSTTKDGLGDTYYPGDIIRFDDRDIVLYAIYSKTYSVTYDLNLPNAKKAIAPIDTLKYIKGANVDLQMPENLEDEDYLFIGWGLNKNDLNVVESSAKEVFGNMILYGKWKEKSEFKVQYDCTGQLADNVCPVDNQTYHLGDTVKLMDIPREYLVRKFYGDDYVFGGWNTPYYKYANMYDLTFDHYSDSITNGVLRVFLNSDNWIDSNFNNRIYYKKNTNDPVENFPDDEIKYISDWSGDVSNKIPERVGYIFNGWNTNADGSGLSFQNYGAIYKSDLSEDHTITLYAQWEKIEEDSREQYVDVNLSFGDTQFTLRYPQNANIVKDDLEEEMLYQIYNGEYEKSDKQIYNDQAFALKFYDKNGTDIFMNKSSVHVADLKSANITAASIQYDVFYFDTLHGKLANQPLVQKAQYGLSLTNIPEPIPDEGYRFAGWQITPAFYPRPQFFSASSVIMPNAYAHSIFIRTTSELEHTKMWNRLFSPTTGLKHNDGKYNVDQITIKPVFEPIENTKVTIKYYYDNVFDPTKTDVFENQKVGDTITSITDKSGGVYTLDKTENLILKISWDPDKNIIKVYYVYKKTSASVEYYYDGKLDESKTETIQNQKVGSTINEYKDKVIENYKLDKVEGMPLTLVEEVDKNVVRVYYVKNEEVQKPVTAIKSDHNKPSNGIHTGDTSTMSLWLMSGFISLLMMITFMWKLRKIRKIK